MNKQKIIFYVDWTDCLAHLTGHPSYVEGETEEEKSSYARNQVNRFFAALNRLQEKYDVELHCVTGGCQDYLNIENPWIDQIHELFDSMGLKDVFKSVVTEYGGDLLVGPDSQLVERPFEDSKVLCTEALFDDIRKVIPESVRDKVELSFYKYFANIRFEDPDMTEEEFNYYYQVISQFNNHEKYTLYPYYCPGYGVEIDVLPNGLDKQRAIESINELFYKDTPRDQIALSVFNGDFYNIDLPMVNHSLTNDVLFVGSEDANIEPQVKGSELKYRQAEHKIAAISSVMEELCNMDLTTHPFDKGGYKYVA